MSVNYDAYFQENKRKFNHIRLLLKKGGLPRRRPRDREEELVLRILALRRWNNEIKNGKLIEISPRRYRIVK